MTKQYDKMLFERFNLDLSKLKPEQIKSLISVKAKKIIPSIDDVDFSKKQAVKLGIDATGAELHLGHLCPLVIMDIFSRSGHHIDFVIGDYTSKIGDPSGRVSERPPITDHEIAKNFATYVAQVSRFIDTKKWTVVKNSTWLGKMTFGDFLGIAKNINAATILQRDDFRTRLESGGVTMAELTYGILQGLDSVALKTTIELGGIDQLLNLQQGREIQRLHAQPAQVIITNPLLEGLSGDGKKMGKSYNNYIALVASSEDKFGLLMSMSDNALLQYYKCFGYLFEHEITELAEFIKKQPLEAKKQFATYFVAIEQKDFSKGLQEREKFEKKFSKKELTVEDFKTIKAKPNMHLIDILMTSGDFKSRSELKRLLEEGAIKDLSDGATIENDFVVTANEKIKVGKRKFFNILVNIPG